MKLDRRQVLLATCLLLPSCGDNRTGQPATNTIYDAFSEKFYDFVDVNAEFMVLGSGYQWSEGPSWDSKRRKLYFTDVPQNTAYSWDEINGIQIFLKPSGADVSEGFREPGANGLFMGNSGHLLICNHGTRSVESMDIDSQKRTILTSRFRQKPFNSPNDLVQGPGGKIYFTDPPYGLEGLDESPLKELQINGVYVLAPNGNVRSLIRNLTRPNGIGLSPDSKTLYVAQSDPDAQHIYSLNLTDPKAEKTLFADLSLYAGDNLPGLPDGMTIDHQGNLFATGPGGVFIITPDGNVLGRIKTGKGSSNCTFGEDGSTLFITNHDRLVKLRTRTKGLPWK